MQLILIRHFHSQGNEDRKHYHDPGDRVLSLSEKGKAEASATAKALEKLFQEYGVTRADEVVFLRSPYQRTKETFEEIQKHSDHSLVSQASDPQQVEWLSEMGLGKAFDLNDEERYALYPRNVEAFNRAIDESPETLKYLYGESAGEMKARIEQADLPTQLAEWKRQGKKLVVCVSHQLAINALCSVMFEKDVASIHTGERLSNGGILRLEIDEHGKPIGQPDCAFGTYAAEVIRPLKTGEKRETDVCPTKRIRHTVLQAAHPEGLMAPEDEIPPDCVAISHIERLLAEQSGAETGKNLLPGRK